MKKNVLGFLLLFSLGACDKDEATVEIAKINVVHASPDAPGVDLLIDDTRRNAPALTYPNATGYFITNSGSRIIKVNASGTNTTVATATVTLTRDKNYSIFAYNQLAQIGLLMVQDDLTPPTGAQSHIRFFHLSPDAPAVTVGTLSGGVFSPVFSNRGFETQATASENQQFTPVPAGVYTFDVRVAGNSVLTIPDITLQAGKIYTVFARGLVAGTGEQALGAQVITHN